MIIDLNARTDQVKRRYSFVFTMLFVLFPQFFLVACDPDGKKNCDWVLEAEPTLKDKVTSGYIPVCARNRVTNKQDCRLQSSLEFAKKSFGKKFRYTELEIESVALPRTIKRITFCE